MASGTSGAQQSTERKSCPLHIKGDIRFDHVSFAFPDDPETPILKDLDFTVPAGSKLGILGETGAGKSTLVSLISRFYDPTVGHVLIDGIDARDWPLATLRSQVCIVAQDTFLFSDTIGGNIGFGASGDSDDRYIQKMAQIAGADNFISRCHRVMTPSWANAAWACPAGRSSACRWPARSRTIRRS